MGLGTRIETFMWLPFHVRLSAVFGGVYCLKRSVRELIISSDRKQ